MTTIDSKFRLVLLAAKRAEQIIQGSTPKVKTNHSKATYIALEEIQKKAIDYSYKKVTGEEVKVKAQKEKE
jgi:DNA-directed RNA polymerase subunit omega